MGYLGTVPYKTGALNAVDPVKGIWYLTREVMALTYLNGGYDILLLL